MPQVERVRSHKYRKYALPAAVGVLGLVLAGVALWFYTLPTPTAAAARADQLNAEAHYGEAIRELKRAQWRAFSRQDKALVVSRLAASYMNQGSLEQALQYYEELERLDPVYSNILTVAELAERMERKDVAKAAYERAKQSAQKLPEESRQRELTRVEYHLGELSK